MPLARPGEAIESSWGVERKAERALVDPIERRQARAGSAMIPRSPTAFIPVSSRAAMRSSSAAATVAMRGDSASSTFRAGTVRDLGVGGSAPQYLSSGHLLWEREGQVWAAPFDRDGLRLTGDAVPVIDPRVDQPGVALVCGIGQRDPGDHRRCPERPGRSRPRWQPPSSCRRHRGIERSQTVS